MQWKVQIEGDDESIAKLSQSNSPGGQLTRDGTGWFLESNEFPLISDHVEVKQKALEIIQHLLTVNALPPQSNVVVGAVYRIHYDNSKSVYR